LQPNHLKRLSHANFCTSIADLALIPCPVGGKILLGAPKIAKFFEIPFGLEILQLLNSTPQTNI
jgi:hypothetical protein